MISYLEFEKPVAALEAERNVTQATIKWRFTTGDARVRLAHLYPNLKPARQLDL